MLLLRLRLPASAAGGLSSRSTPTEELYINDFLPCCALPAWQGCAVHGAYRLLILMPALSGAICFAMARPASLAVALAASSLAIGAASPIASQSADQKQAAPQPRMVFVPGRGTVLVQPVPTDDPHAVARTVIVPGYGEVYAVPVRPKDTRSPRQRCLDDEAARIGGTLSDLDRSSIDLKCSQR